MRVQRDGRSQQRQHVHAIERTRWRVDVMQAAAVGSTLQGCCGVRPTVGSRLRQILQIAE
jgi:hypothetical protein